MNPIAVFESIRLGLVGTPLSLLWRGHGSAIFLEFGKLTTNGKRRNGSERNPIGEFSIGIGWSWRLEDERSIVAGSLSEEGDWDRAFNCIRNARLTAVRTYSRLPELELEFDNRHHLLSFRTSDGQPDWFIIDTRSKEPMTLIVDNGQLAIETNL
ncbi:MAG: hypothetical protein JNM43_27785 [Planctomycetaceae bacterium]|nr:hypothetical protein [Planctomycetaceae bacterium]